MAIAPIDPAIALAQAAATQALPQQQIPGMINPSGAVGPGMIDPSTGLAYAQPQQNYTSPELLRRMNEYARLLQESSQGGEIRHWSQGVKQMVDALVGGHLQHKAGLADRTNRELRAGVVPSRVPENATLTGNRQSASLVNESTPSRDALALAPGGSKNLEALASVETGGQKDPYRTVGPKSKDGDQPYGRYQVMGKNIGPWSREVLGRELSKDEFLSSKEAQDAIAKTKFGQYEAKYGPQGAARAWFAGEGGMNNMSAKDILGTTVADYENRFNRALGFAPNTPRNGVEAITMALTKGATGQPQQMAQANPSNPTGEIHINPNLIRRRPTVSEEQFRRGMSYDLSPAEQQALMGGYYEEFQPLEIPFMGGRLLVDPRNPSNQQFLPTIEKDEIKAGDAQFPIRTVPQPGRPGTPPRMLVAPMEIAPGSGITAPVMRPSSPPPLEDVPNLFKYADENAATGGVAPPTTPVPEGFPQGGENAAPKEAPTIGGLMNAPAPEAIGAGAATAQSLVPQVFKDTISDLQSISAEGKRRSEQATKEAQKFADRYESITNAGHIAQRAKSEFEHARNLLDDPRFISGVFAGQRLDVARLLDWLNLNPGAAAPTEIFQKIMSKGIIEDMKTMLQGLGQIRIAEIDLLAKATGNIYNTLDANKAVIEVLRNTHNLIGNLSKMSSYYAQGVRWDKDGNPYQTNNRGLDAGWDIVAQKYVDAHPIIPKDQKAAYERALTSAPTYDPKATAAAEKELRAASLGRGVNVGTTNVPDKRQQISPNEYKVENRMRINGRDYEIRVFKDGTKQPYDVTKEK